VQKAYEIEERQFDYNVTSALLQVVELIADNNPDAAPIYDPIDRPSPNVYTVNINDTLHPFYLESLLKAEFKKQEINQPFQYSIHDCFTDSVVYERNVKYNNEDAHPISPPAINWGKDNHHFSVFFPNREAGMAGRLNFWIYSSAFLIIVIAFFSYTISVILRQRRLSEIKTDFINNMTHEFKTPIATIGLSSEVLLKDSILDKPEKLKNYATIINQENKRLRHQVERILQIATIERERINLRSNPVDVHQILSKVSETFRLNIEANNGQSEVILNAQMSTIEGDEVHLTNIFSNLIDNAIKYSGENPVVKISTQNKGRNIEISIADEGIGIDPSEQRNIFEKFYRVPQGNLHDVKGFGIGLNYVKVMVEQHGGNIRVKPNSPKGSIFTVSFPLNT
jgi:two-component system phosphate regulon sensor histidine kinase PhoR